MSHDVELLVIGSGPAGQKAAIQGAKLGKRVAIVERGHMVGGVCVNTGTIPSKSLREAIVYLTGMSQREIYGSSYRVKPEITIADLDRAHATRDRARDGRDPATSSSATTSSCCTARRGSSTRTR